MLIVLFFILFKISVSVSTLCQIHSKRETEFWKCYLRFYTQMGKQIPSENISSLGLVCKSSFNQLFCSYRLAL